MKPDCTYSRPEQHTAVVALKIVETQLLFYLLCSYSSDSTMEAPRNTGLSATKQAEPPSNPSFNPQIGQLAGNGTFGYVWRIADDRVRKEPKIWPETDPDTACVNMTRRFEIQNEISNYERLGKHDGIIECLDLQKESIELAFANQGDLSSYIKSQPVPTEAFRVKWIQSLVDSFSYVHSRRVVVQDIALRNVLVHNGSLKLCDFGQSTLLPMDTDMANFCANDTTPKIEILQLGCMLYSIAVWQELKYDYYDTQCWPGVADLPSTADVLLSSVIEKCFRGEFASMEALQDCVHDMMDQAVS